MKHIGTVQAVVTADDYDREPTAAELEGIEREMPLITAERELLEVRITVLDRLPNELDRRRIRRARRRVLAARRELANQSVLELPGVSA
ncbi:hypothetical protein GCM10012287_46640 [Streptomyces daqingensis]|uniref:50S ribosomal protein L29 n=1 Tax=Streptomyces daqingensis TaxID=1472640 RepID=A0ABQ2MQ65_9ACTN|nr:DUF6284 family protein [Streptomyces daqingensis]GGO55417.1 hypothetical protein GCM10012287_46640 [Streptomyces daqingensis]